MTYVLLRKVAIKAVRLLLVALRNVRHTCKSFVRLDHTIQHLQRDLTRGVHPLRLRRTTCVKRHIKRVATRP